VEGIPLAIAVDGGICMRQIALTVLALAAAVASGCGGGGGASTPTTPTPSGGGTQTTVTISITGVNGRQSFTPNPASVSAGQLVVFRNADVVAHHVMLDDNSLQTTDIAPGASSAALPVGNINKSYHCSLHPSMVGSFNQADTPEPPPCTGYCG
jgi:plastocyanin